MIRTKSEFEGQFETQVPKKTIKISRKSIASVSESISKIIGYQAATHHNSLVPQLKNWNFYSVLMYQLINMMPYYTFIGYLKQYLAEKNLNLA